MARVCVSCNDILVPLQQELVANLSNGLRSNTIDLNDMCTRQCNLPFSATMGSEIRKAAYSLANLFSKGCIEDRAIPIELFNKCKGIAFLTVAKCGFLYCPKVGTGLVVAKLSNNRGWSAPAAVYTVGMGWGFMIGAEVTDYVIILNRCTHMQTQVYASTHIYTHTDTLTNTYRHAHTHTNTLSHTHTYLGTLTHTLSHTRTHAHAHSTSTRIHILTRNT